MRWDESSLPQAIKAWSLSPIPKYALYICHGSSCQFLPDKLLSNFYDLGQCCPIFPASLCYTLPHGPFPPATQNLSSSLNIPAFANSIPSGLADLFLFFQSNFKIPVKSQPCELIPLWALSILSPLVSSHCIESICFSV